MLYRVGIIPGQDLTIRNGQAHISYRKHFFCYIIRPRHLHINRQIPFHLQIVHWNKTGYFTQIDITFQVCINMRGFRVCQLNNLRKYFQRRQMQVLYRKYRVPVIVTCIEPLILKLIFSMPPEDL